MFIGKNIRFLRIRAGMSQQELADRFGYKSFTTVQKWESGVSTPPLKQFIEMADMFGVDIDDFAGKDLSASDAVPSPDMRSLFSIPVYGRYPAPVPVDYVIGSSAYFEQNSKSSDSRMKYFALRLSDDSMEPKFNKEDLVVFEETDQFISGDDCMISLEGQDAVLRRIWISDNSVILQPLNPEYTPVNMSTESIGTTLRILGKAIEIRRRI